MNYPQLGDYRSSLMSCHIDKNHFIEERNNSMLSAYNTEGLGGSTKLEKDSCRNGMLDNSQMKSVNSKIDNESANRKEFGSDNVNYNTEEDKIRSNNNNNSSSANNNSYQDDKLKSCTQSHTFDSKDKCNDISDTSQLENTDKSTHLEIHSSDTNMMGNNTTESNYPRDNNDIRYTNLNDSRPSSYSTNDPTSNRNVEYEVQQMVHSTSHRPYDPGSSLVNSQQTAFERYDSNYPSQRQNLYSSYGQSGIGDVNSQSKYLLDSQNINTTMKVEHDENTGPIYPRPLYQYDPIATTIPSGFSAMNLSVKISSSQLASYKTSSSSPSPTSTTNTTVNSNVPIIDLSTNGITSTSSNGFGTAGFGSSRKSPSGNETGQTLDLSVNRISHRYGRPSQKSPQGF